jgi:small subunit ribosomal protein S16
MLKIRLQRTGRKNEPYFRLVLTDSKNATKSGKFLKVLGAYDPKAGTFKADAEEVLKRIKEGAQVSPTVHNFLVKEKMIEGKKKNVLAKKSPTVKRKELKK